MDWSKEVNFDEAEFRCTQTGECRMQPDFMRKLQALREEYGKPLTITSGYRSPQHSIEASKAAPGVHTRHCVRCGGIGPRGARGHASGLQTRFHGHWRRAEGIRTLCASRHFHGRATA